MTIEYTGNPEHPLLPARDWWQAVRRGLSLKCPSCGIGKMYRAYLKVNDTCPHCGEELHHHRADDAPPYFTIFILGHIVVPLVLWRWHSTRRSGCTWRCGYRWRLFWH